ncbi:hypothetical protein K439DRAFT_1643424 [Ramaria rubella]|nr:hypothetical protein K439DRAFT_1643424 [Ramaria rubella]
MLAPIAVHRLIHHPTHMLLLPSFLPSISTHAHSTAVTPTHLDFARHSDLAPSLPLPFERCRHGGVVEEARDHDCARSLCAHITNVSSNSSHATDDLLYALAPPQRLHKT